MLLQKLGSFTEPGLSAPLLRSLHARCGNKHCVWHWHDWDWPVAVINGNITMDRIMPAQWPGPDTQLTYQWSEPESEGGGRLGEFESVKRVWRVWEMDGGDCQEWHRSTWHTLTTTWDSPNITFSIYHIPFCTCVWISLKYFLKYGKIFLCPSLH